MAITDPRDIPGLVAWYSAEAETGYTDGQVVGDWTDLSGNGNHAVATLSGVVWKASTAELASPSLRFGGNGFFTLPDVMSGATSGEIFASIRDGKGANASGNGHWDFGGNSTFFTYTAERVYENFGHPDRVLAGSVSSGPFIRWNVTADAGTNGYLCRVDGAQLYVGTTTPAFDSAPRIGSASSSLHFLGDMGAVVIYNRALGTTERADLDAWLTANPSGGSLVAAPTSVTLAASAAHAVAAFDLTTPLPPTGIALAASAQAATASFTLTQPTTVAEITLAGVASPAVAAFTLDQAPVEQATTDRVNRSNGRTRVMEWTVEVEPPVVEPSRTRGHDYAVAATTPPPTLVDGRPT